MLSFGPMTGYEMKKYIDNSITHFWNENYGRIYPVLRSLEKEGLVSKKTEMAEGRPMRHVYSLTDRGREALRMWLRLPAERPVWRMELLLKLFFGDQISKENMIQKVESELAFCRHTLGTFQQLEDHIKGEESEKTRGGIHYGLITLRFGQHYYRAVSEWCEETLELLRASSPRES
jgi:DNA-binding PadR family transcriptional regulator